MSPRLRALLQAAFVTFLWSASWPLIKIGLEDLPPLTFAAGRYVVAALALWIVSLGRTWAGRRTRDGSHTSKPVSSGVGWRWLALVGFLSFAIPPAAQFIGLHVLPANSVSLLFNFIPIATMLTSTFLVKEPPTRGQVFGILVATAAALGYFYPFSFSPDESFGVLAVLISVVSVALVTVLMRGVMRDGQASSLQVTRDTMSIGGGVLLVSAVAVEGVPLLSVRSVGIILLLATVNTAFTFVVWNHALRVITAIESTVLANTMLVQIAILIWLTIGERPKAFQAVLLLVVAASTIWVQLHGRVAPAGADSTVG